jgi:hypothetical protein
MRFAHFMLFLPVILAVALLPGCDKGAVTTKPKKRQASSGDEVEVPRVGVAAAKYGTITGKVVYDGTPPTPKALDRGQNEAQCHAPAPNERENFDETWLVDPSTKGVKNAVIFLQPPQGKFFEIPSEQLKANADIEIDQPLCAFRPRVFVLFPNYYDKATNSQKETGQKLVIRNDAPFEHNYKILAVEEYRGANRILKRGDSSIVGGLQPLSKPLTISCDIHSWMRAYGFILEHPYAAVTDKDGNFKIDNAPLGVPLQVVGWHEGPGFFNGGEEGRTATLPDPKMLDLIKIKSR